MPNIQPALLSLFNMCEACTHQCDGTSNFSWPRGLDVCLAIGQSHLVIFPFLSINASASMLYAGLLSISFGGIPNWLSRIWVCLGNQIWKFPWCHPWAFVNTFFTCHIAEVPLHAPVAMMPWIFTQSRHGLFVVARLAGVWVCNGVKTNDFGRGRLSRITTVVALLRACV